MMGLLKPTTTEDDMSTEEIIIRLFCMVDDRIGPVNKRSDAKLYASEIVTIGLLFSLKGGHWRAFYRWLAANFEYLFPKLPEQSRLFRLIDSYGEFAEDLLAELTTFTVLDTFGVELIHPRRQGRSRHPLGKKGKSNGRWIVGVKLAWLINQRGEVVTWAWDTADAPDNVFRGLGTQYDGQTITLCDLGLREADVPQQNLKYCRRGKWNERYCIETNFSWLTELLHAKKLYHRVERHLVQRFAYLAALMNCLLRLTPNNRSLTCFAI
jgi:hypothetical protein